MVLNVEGVRIQIGRHINVPGSFLVGLGHRGLKGSKENDYKEAF